MRTPRRFALAAAIVVVASATACTPAPEVPRVRAWSLAFRLSHAPPHPDDRVLPIVFDLDLELSRGRTRAPDGTRIELTTSGGRFSDGRSVTAVTTSGGRARVRLLFFSTTEKAVVTARAGDTEAQVRVAPGAT